jgi:hypothetical protein
MMRREVPRRLDPDAFAALEALVAGGMGDVDAVDAGKPPVVIGPTGRGRGHLAIT